MKVLKPARDKRYFFLTLLISILFHVGALVALIYQPLYLKIRLLNSPSKSSPILAEAHDFEILLKNKMLEETFSSFSLSGPAEIGARTSLEMAQFPQQEFEPSLNLPNESSHILATEGPELKELSLTSPFNPFFLEERVENRFIFSNPSEAKPALTQDLLLDSIPFLNQVEIKSPSYFSYEQKDTLLSQPLEERDNLNILETKLYPIVSSDISMIPFKEPRELNTSYPLFENTAEIPLKKSVFANKPQPFFHNSLSPKEYGLEALAQGDWSSFFDVDVKVCEKEEGGYLFSLSLIPKENLSDDALKQTFIFIIDRSNSVDKFRYETFKKAVSRALGSLREGDHFNVIVIDALITPLSDKPVIFNKKTQKQAEEFLEKQKRGSYGSATDIYATLNKMLPIIMQESEATTAILFSDGDSHLKPADQRKKIKQWSSLSQGEIHLYTATSGEDNNLLALKMLARASRGSLIYSDTHAAFPRKLAKTVSDLRYPLLKGLSCSIQSTDTSAKFKLLPSGQTLSYLLSSQPFVLMGECDKLCEMNLVLEGKNKDQFFKISKHISLAKGKKGTRLLEKHWKQEKLDESLDHYLQQGNVSLLKQLQKEITHAAQSSRR